MVEVVEVVLVGVWDAGVVWCGGGGGGVNVCVAAYVRMSALHQPRNWQSWLQCLASVHADLVLESLQLTHM